MLSSSSFRNPACKFPRTGLAPHSKNSFLKPSYVSSGNIPLDTTPFVLFNAFTHRLTSPPVKISQYVSFVETCLGSQHPFKLGISVIQSRLQPYPYHYSMAFAFSSILCPLSLPLSSRSGYHNTYVWNLLGLPSSLCPTFNRALREALSPGCAMDDKEVKKYHFYPATHLFGLGVSATFRRFIITRFIAPSR